MTTAAEAVGLEGDRITRISFNAHSWPEVNRVAIFCVVERGCWLAAGRE